MVASPGCQGTGSRMGYLGEVLLLLVIRAGAQLRCAAAFSIAPFNNFARQMTPFTINWRFHLLPRLFYSLWCKHRPHLLCCTVGDSIIATDNQSVCPLTQFLWQKRLCGRYCSNSVKGFVCVLGCSRRLWKDPWQLGHRVMVLWDMKHPGSSAREDNVPASVLSTGSPVCV